MLTAIRILLTTLILGAAFVTELASAQQPDTESEDTPIKYAIYSSAWSESSNAGLRIVAQNQHTAPVELVSLAFRDDLDIKREALLSLKLEIPAQGWAETQLPYVDLIFGNDCISKTQQDDWRLVEISNYTLNPSVRGLIIQDTDSFRIYQCVRPVLTTWVEAGKSFEQAEWVLYHYERRPAGN